MVTDEKYKTCVSGIKIKKEIPSSNYVRYLSVVETLIRRGGLQFDAPVTFLVGENGIGKSTLIEAIAVNYGFNPEGGNKNYRFQTKPSHSILHEYVTLVKTPNYAKDGYFLRAESFYNTLSYMDYLNAEQFSDKRYLDYLNDAGAEGISMHNASHGESFLQAVNNFMGNGLYILDEPEAALSPTGIMKLIFMICELVEKKSQFIISTHSPMLLATPNSVVYQISENSIEKVPFEETNHYVITKKFLNHPNQMIKQLLDG